MATLTIRDLDDDVRDRLRVRAAHNRRSMEAEVRAILTEQLAVAPPSPVGLGSRIHLRFVGVGLDADLDVPERTDVVRGVSWDD